MTGRLAFLVVCLGAAACSEKAIDIDLRAANAPGAGTIDLSCIDSVGVYAYGDAINDIVTNCALVDPSSERSLDDLQLSGALSMPMPTSGLSSIFLSGMTDACQGASAFYGGAAYRGGDSLVVYVYPNLSCNRRNPNPVDFHVFDFLQVLTDGTCGPAGTGLSLMGGTIHNDPTIGTSYFEQSSAAIGVVDGVASITGTYSQAEGAGCLAAGLIAGQSLVATGCVYPGSSVCASAGQYEMAYVDYGTLDASDNDQAGADFDTATLAVIWDPATRRGIAGAAVTIKHGEGAVVYTNYAGGEFSPITSGGVTGTSGTLTFYSNTPAEVEITAPGYRTRTIFLGSDGFSQAGSAAVIPLAR